MNQSQIIDSFKSSIDVSQEILRTSWEENISIEFKRSLQVKSDEIDKQYLTTISGLANNKGGILVFGIDNTSKELIGIKPTLENLDNRFFATTIRQGLDGSFEYFFFTAKFLTKIIGFLYVAEANVKPVIIRVSSSDIVRGEIYYRYPAQTTRIEAADLRKMIDDEVQKKLLASVKTMQAIANIGPDKVALLNTENGEVDIQKESHQKFILNQESLKELNLIKQGTFVETEGADAFIVKGEFEIEVEDYEKIIEINIPTLAKESEIYKSFFSSTCEHPEVMIEQILINQSQYAPIFFFIKKSNMTLEQAITFIERIDSRESAKLTKKRILDRINKPEMVAQGALLTDIRHSFSEGKDFDALVLDVKNALNLTAKRIELQIARTILYNTLLNTIPIAIEIYPKHLKRALEAMSNLPKNFIIKNREYVLSEVAKIFDTKRDNEQSTLMRKSISNIDTALYLHKVKFLYTFQAANL